MQLATVVRAVTGLSALCGLALSVPADAAADSPPARGTLRGVVFDAEGAPRAGVRVRVGRSELRSNADGAFVLDLPPGQHPLRVQSEGQEQAAGAVRIVAGETTEALINLRRGQPPLLEVEAPGAGHRPGVARRDDRPRVAVQGSLVDAKDGAPVADARVFARGTAAEGRSGPDGSFTMRLPVGVHELTVIHPSFATETVPGVVVSAAGLARPLRLRLTAAAVQLEDYTVVAPRIVGGTAGLLELRREASTVTELIGAEQWSKTGDSDAASALGRVSGITVVGGKYVYIRGLGERYSSTTLNSSALPSPEPERRVVPLDMFPVGVLEDIAIQKTYTPDLPGDFSGGMVQLRTRGFPARFHANLGVSVGVNDASIGRRTITPADSGGSDWITFGAGRRALPDVVRAASDRGKIQLKSAFAPGYTEEELEAFGEAMPGNWGLPERRLWPDLGLSGTIGTSGKVRGGRAGFLFSFGYDNEWRRVLRDPLLPNLRIGAAGLEVGDRLTSTEVEHEVKLSTVGTTGLDLAGGKHKLRLTAMMVRILEDEARRIEGFDADSVTTKRGTRVWFRERMLTFGQLAGEHELRRLPAGRQGLGLALDWRYAFSTATLDEPDRRSTRYDEEASQPGVFVISNRPDGNQRFYSTLLDLNHDVSLDLTLRFRQWRGLEAKVKAGANVGFSNREVDTRRFSFTGSPSDPSALSLPPEQLFVPAHIGESGFRFLESTRETDNYRADQTLYCGYVMTELPLARPLLLMAGVRLEQSDRTVETFQLFAGEGAEPIRAQPSTLDALPTLTLSYRPFGPQHVFRAGYSRTLNRPQTRELSPAPFDDPDTGKQYRGNPQLGRAMLDNLDLRWEWYPSRLESVSVAAFYKRFTDPIELVAVAGAAVTLEPQNAAGANNVGVELEARKRLGFIHRRLRDLTLGGNLSFIFSRVELAEGSSMVSTNRSRPLQGQSPWVVNLFLAYDSVRLGTSARLLYNVYGPRISEVGSAGRPDEYEQPYHRLDLVASQRLNRYLSLSLKARNLLNLRHELTQKDEATGHELVVDSYTPGRDFSLSLTVEY